MAATVVFDSNQMEETKLDINKVNDRGPTAKEIAACAPCRMVLVVLFVAALLAMLVGAIIIIATAEKCAIKVTKTRQEQVQTGMVYFVSPRAFLDSDGDGNGDLKGLAEKLPYIKETLGLKIIALSDVLNVSDHKQIDSRIGTLNDFDSLVQKAKEMGMHVLVSFNPVYTGRKHALFVESAANVSAYGDRYIFANSPTTNWENFNKTSGWYSMSNSTFYYGYYGQAFPSLNYGNADVKSYMKDVLKFWMGKNIAGVVLEGVAQLITSIELKDNTAGKSYTEDLPGVHALLASWRDVVDSHNKGVLLGSLGASVSSSGAYYGSKANPELAVVLDDSLVQSLPTAGATAFNTTLANLLKVTPASGSASWSSGLKDRLANTVGGTKTLTYLAMLATLPGQFSMLYGDEIAMVNSQSSSRALMQWDSSNAAGFTTGTPYQQVNPDYATKNVAAMNSTVAIIKALATVRLEQEAFSGTNLVVLSSGNDVVAYLRHHNKDQCVVAINLGSSTKSNVNLKKDLVRSAKGTVLVDTANAKAGGTKLDLTKVELAAYQAVIYSVE